MARISKVLDEKLGNLTPTQRISKALGGGKGTISTILGRKEIEVNDNPLKYTVTYNANGGVGTIDSVSVTAGESITLSDGTGLTAPEDKEFAGWAKSSSAQSATVTSPFTPDKDTTLYAVWINVETEPAGE